MKIPRFLIKISLVLTAVIALIIPAACTESEPAPQVIVVPSATVIEIPVPTIILIPSPTVITVTVPTFIAIPSATVIEVPVPEQTIIAAPIPTPSLTGIPTLTATSTPTQTITSTPTPPITPIPTSVIVDLIAHNIAFNLSQITVPAGAHITVNFTNQDNGVPHNFAVYTDPSAATMIFRGNIITGPSTATYTFTAPAAPGNYFFRCDVHPTAMTGQLVVQ